MTMTSFYKTKRKHEIDRSLSFTRLKDFAENGPKALISRSSAHSIAMSIGQLTDDFLNEEIKIRDKYIIFDGQKPSATLGKLTNFILDNYRKVPKKKEILKIIEKNNYWSGTKKEDLIIKKFDIPEFWDYLKLMMSDTKKEIITSEMYTKAEEMAVLIKTHEHTKSMFSDDYQRVYQYFFKISIRNVVFRGAIDYIMIDHKNKTVQIVDFKTGKDPAEDFSKVFLYMRYYLQEAVYMKAFRSICKKFKLKKYNLLPFKFIYISKSEMIPTKYTVTKKWHNAGLNGFRTISGYKYKGLYELIDDVVWHYQNRIFDMPKKLYESKGSLKLDDNFINV
jgi:hypothetical protein